MPFSKGKAEIIEIFRRETKEKDGRGRRRVKESEKQCRGMGIYK